MRWKVAICERNRVCVFHGLLKEPELAIPLEEDEDDEDRSWKRKRRRNPRKSEFHMLRVVNTVGPRYNSPIGTQNIYLISVTFIKSEKSQGHAIGTE